MSSSSSSIGCSIEFSERNSGALNQDPCDNVSQEQVYRCLFWLILAWAIDANEIDVAPGNTPESQ